MKNFFSTCAMIVSSFATLAASPPVADVAPVTDNYFGIDVVDPYRYMEDVKDPRTAAWMKGQADFARATLDALPDRAAILQDITKYVNAAPATVSGVRRCPGERYFFIKTLSGQALGKLYMRQGLDGKDKLIVDTDRFIGPHGEPPAINYYKPSFDGKLVAYGVSQGGSEDAVIHILDVDGGGEFDETIDRAQFGEVHWRPDNHSFFYNRLQKLGPGDSPLEKYAKSKAYLHVVGTSPDTDTAVFGLGVSPRVEVAPMDIPFVSTMPGSDWVVGTVEHGVKNELTLYEAPNSTLGQADTPWVKICDVDDDVTAYDFKGEDLYLLSHQDAPRFKLLRKSLAYPSLSATVLMPQMPQTHWVLRDVDVAADGVYLRVLDDGIYHVIRLAESETGQTGSQSLLKLPFEGNVGIYPTDPRLSGVMLGLTSWTKGVRVCAYDPTTDQVIPTDLQPAGPYDNLEDLTSEEVQVPGYDGTPIPLSIVYKKGIKRDGTNPTIIDAYGGYGITIDPGFNPMNLAWLERGGIFAVAHCRGGGEEGEEWHKGAYKLTKPNVWRDLISCSEYLINQKYTSPSCLGIFGGSNGGVVIGRAITERPDLFAAAWIQSGLVNALRGEEEPNGPPNIPEFGSAKTQEGFEDLFAMDAYLHVRDGVKYPAVLQVTGINDPRVSPAEPAKFTARLQAASTSGRPILLDVDYQGGHGIGASKAQRVAREADMFAFFLANFHSPVATNSAH